MEINRKLYSLEQGVVDGFISGNYIGNTRIFFLIIGRQFRRGKWLFLIAGNIFNDSSNEKAKKWGGLEGIIMYGLSILFLSFVLYMFTKTKN